MIAPAFKRLAKEYKGRAVFLKVDVNRNYEAASACSIRGMPTFQFYLHKKKISEFSGADERTLRRYTESAVDRSEEVGTYVGLEVTAAALRAFYEEHDQSKLPEVDALAAKYASKTAVLMRVSSQKYGSSPRTSPRLSEGETKKARAGAGGAPAGLGGDLSALPPAELRAEVARLQDELRRRGAPAGDGADDDDEEVPFLPAENATAEGVHRLVIVGGGPAGLSAATYAARAGLRPLVLAPAFGGQLLGKGVDVENYPGVVGEHATGRGLVELMRRQALSFDARLVDAAVLDMDLASRPFAVWVNGTREPIRAHAVILACGAESRWLQVPGEEAFRGRGVSACATCDGFLFRGKDVAVVGGGDTAMEDALHLARSSRRVTVVHRRGRLTASRFLAERVLNHSSISVQWNQTVESFHGAGDLSHVMLKSSVGGQKDRLDVSAVFVAIGHDPQTGFLRGKIEMDSAGYVTLKGGTATSVPGVFAAGDIADHTYRRTIAPPPPILE
ncbi:unnamed protein product [Prorocentrum cordatum]|uniref:Thioredoxin-disulfide reductase n=1 Tax=Prorocentrum cordatum TaxID=2364126 RepID=A0ABN9QXD1_9DINO|nr:unnamed protein product [Polarella glacialis]